MPNFLIKNVYWNELHLWKWNVNCKNRSKLLKFVYISLSTLLYGDNVHDHVTRTGRKPISASITRQQLYIENPNTHDGRLNTNVDFHYWSIVQRSKKLALVFGLNVCLRRTLLHSLLLTSRKQSWLLNTYLAICDIHFLNTESFPDLVYGFT